MIAANSQSATLPIGDSRLVQIVDAALSQAAHKSGSWLVCRPGCAHCCTGVFAINQLDAARLKKGFELLEEQSPSRALELHCRVQASADRLRQGFPGDSETGVLELDTEDARENFAQFGNDEVCPVLDPITGTCELYAYRPMTCRVFGPPVRSSEQDEEGLATCELCYHGATDEQIAACEMVPDPDDLESDLLREMQRSNSASTGAGRETIVAFCLR
jgi:Fe-S-cluster containining protein